MDPKQEVFQPNKSEDQKITSIVHHILLMLSRRIYIDKDKKKQPLMMFAPTTTPEVSTDGTFITKARNGETYATKIFFHKITTSGKQSVISEFIKEYANYKKIIVASDFSNKIADFCVKNGIQLFKEDSMLEDILANRDQPRFELLTPNEMKLVRQEYNVTDYTLTKTPKQEIIAKYFGLKKSDVFRVIRPSATSGYSICYRIVD